MAHREREREEEEEEDESCVICELLIELESSILCLTHSHITNGILQLLNSMMNIYSRWDWYTYVCSVSTCLKWVSIFRFTFYETKIANIEWGHFFYLRFWKEWFSGIARESLSSSLARISIYMTLSMHLCMELSEKTKLENYFPSKTASKFTHFEMAEWTKLWPAFSLEIRFHGANTN